MNKGVRTNEQRWNYGTKKKEMKKDSAVSLFEAGLFTPLFEKIFRLFVDC